MYFKYSAGFLIASLIQAGIILLTESLRLSSLGAKLTATQLLIHIAAGQVVGYILLFIMRRLKIIHSANVLTLGGITGFIAWLILLTVNSEQGTVRAPWTQGIPTVLSSLTAFIAFGVLAAYTIKVNNYERVEA